MVWADGRVNWPHPELQGEVELVENRAARTKKPRDDKEREASMPMVTAPRPPSITDEELEELERVGREAARKLQEAGVTYEQVVQDVTSYVHRLRTIRERRRAARSR